MRRLNHGPEEVLRLDFGRLQEEVIYERTEQPVLYTHISMCLLIAPCSKKVPTCHTKGRFLRFRRARRTAINLHTPPGTFTPNTRARRSRNDSLNIAARDTLATPSTSDICGNRRVADIVYIRQEFLRSRKRKDDRSSGGGWISDHGTRKLLARGRESTKDVRRRATDDRSLPAPCSYVEDLIAAHSARLHA